MKSSSPSLTTTSTDPTPKRRGRHPFQIKGRSGWQAEYQYHDGATQRRTFATADLANAWLDEQVLLDDVVKGPLLGGPQRVTLGRFLGEYAYRVSIAKQSYATEIDRINHYVHQPRSYGAGRYQPPGGSGSKRPKGRRQDAGKGKGSRTRAQARSALRRSLECVPGIRSCGA